MRLTIFVLALALLLVLVLLFFSLLSPRKAEVYRIAEVRQRHDTVYIIRRVPVRTVKYVTVPRVDTVRVSTTLGFVMMHDTLTPSGDSVRVVASYPPPLLSVYFRTAPVLDTTVLLRQGIERLLRDTIVVQRTSWSERALLFVTGVALGAVASRVIAK